MKEYLVDIVKLITDNLRGQERFTASLSMETLDYARFNHAQIRQAGTVFQQYVVIDLIDGKKHVTANLGLARNLTLDKETIANCIKRQREQLAFSSDDPFLMIHEGNHSTDSIFTHELTDKNQVVDTILTEAHGLDLVGYYFGGPIYKGFANSYGQINWFEKSSFVVDTSVYHSGDKAIKQSYAGTKFDRDILAKKFADAKRGLSMFNQEAMTIAPGNYRVYLSPNAVYELLSMINWGGFSRKEIEVKTSPLMPAINEQKHFASAFALKENIGAGVGPNFQAQGFMKPAQLAIIDQGKVVNTLISPKTAREYNLDHNGADESETMSSIDMQGGQLEDEDILGTLGDGLYINNLWYLNFSDRRNGCLTGMTRFFSFVVKNGKPVAPFSVMRFDESIYRLFGDQLQHITKNRELLIDSGTYDERSTTCALLPGIIAENVRFTL